MEIEIIPKTSPVMSPCALQTLPSLKHYLQHLPAFPEMVLGTQSLPDSDLHVLWNLIPNILRSKLDWGSPVSPVKYPLLVFMPSELGKQHLLPCFACMLRTDLWLPFFLTWLLSHVLAAKWVLYFFLVVKGGSWGLKRPLLYRIKRVKFVIAKITVCLPQDKYSKFILCRMLFVDLITL